MTVCVCFKTGPFKLTFNFHKENIKERLYIYLEEELPKMPPELLGTALLPANIELVLPLLVV